ncbi:type I restriction-modification system subunit M [Nitratifractor salsuginis]|uniref:site-specific DNA-methyltransferase (adenine-specific) n=1 Tax=Nitratifractor salsuginis (strain DSM 16511 / JCM 12458 / E9I37-1) TaxID=749222 RepID=E6WYW4_NITSE|nr:class I SAM-dependent DNA methyltransferase [Nitratifractor salsuginis]ADV46550.1 N-6 DNA methylase [Nitratifractor salsuginis DSM 16511]
MTNFKQKADLIWDIAGLLRGDYKRSDYGKVILPLTVLRRLDAVLAPTKEKVLAALPRVEKMSENAKDLYLNKIAGYNFHNRSRFDFAKIVADPNNVAMNLRNYINGFSSNAREIIEYFNFDDQIDRMDDPKSDLLYQVVKAFAEMPFDDVDSMQMGYIFEELIRKFAEQSNETAGEHFTPREVIELMVNLLFNSDREIFKEGIVKTLYDPACGTGGMLSIGENHIKRLNPDAKLELFGQEINPESYAICKSDTLIKGENPSNIKFGNTFTVDGLRDEKFDYMLSNPPFGVEWKKAAKTIKAEYENLGFAGRFGAGLPRINDGSLLFLQHMISKMKPEGSRIGIVFNGSPLFTGQAGSGESNIRRWIIENDWLEAIVALPDQLFYNTGIATYIWVLNNQKDAKCRGKIQLINATGSKDEALMEEGKRDFNRFWEKMPRSLGDKRKRIPTNDDERGINYITKLYGEFEEGEFVKIFPNDYFGYWRVTVERPLRDEAGNIVTDTKGRPKPDKELRDTENIPFLREDEEGNLVPQSIEEYFEREVLPHVPDAWIDESKTKIGYEINFDKYFYEFKPLRSLDAIRADILALEESSRELERQVLQ